MLERDIRHFAFPLNVYAELLRLETGAVEYLHYGFFAAPDESVTAAQARATDWLFERLPAPCRLLEVGIGLGATLGQLARAGFAVHGITPDAGQIRITQARNAGLPLTEARFEDFDSAEPFDLLLFQESSQYIDSRSLWRRAASLLGAPGRVMVLDEFRCGGGGNLHALDEFLAAANEAGFALDAQSDQSAAAAPTVDHLLAAVERHWSTVVALPGVSEAALHALQASNRQYKERYADGSYRYLFLDFSLTRYGEVQLVSRSM
jgi:hypothetical protein